MGVTVIEFQSLNLGIPFCLLRDQLRRSIIKNSWFKPQGELMETKDSRAPFVRMIEVAMPTHLGFHLRVVARFVTRVKQFRSAIRVRKGKITADGKDMLGLLLLAAAWRSKLHIEAEGDDAEQAIESIRSFFLTEKP